MNEAEILKVPLMWKFQLAKQISVSYVFQNSNSTTYRKFNPNLKMG